MGLSEITKKLNTTHTSFTHKRIQYSLAEILNDNSKIEYVDVEHPVKSVIGYWPADVYFKTNNGEVGIIEVETGGGEREKGKVLRKFYTFLHLEEKRDFLYFAYPIYVSPPIDEIGYISERLNVQVPYVYRISYRSLNNAYCVQLRNIDNDLTHVCIKARKINGGFNIF